MKKTPDYYLLYVRDHVKQDRPGNVLSSFFVRKYPKEPLCVYCTLEHYLERTQLVRDYDNGHFHMSNLIGTLVRVQLDDRLKLFWEQVKWTQQSLRLTAPDQQLHRKQVV